MVSISPRHLLRRFQKLIGSVLTTTAKFQQISLKLHKRMRITFVVCTASHVIFELNVIDNLGSAHLPMRQGIRGGNVV